MHWYIIINLFVIGIFIALFLVLKKTDKKRLKIDRYIQILTQKVNSVRYGNLATKIEKIEHANYRNLSESINRLVETLSDREKMIVEYQSELTRQNKFLESVINSLSDGILIVDENYKILLVTPKIIEWFSEDGANKTDKDFIDTNLLDYIQPKSNIKYEKFKESEIFIANNNSSSFEATTLKLNLDDKKKRFVIVIKDTTNQKELEKLREDFIATLTHDLKVPIVAESNILEFLISGKFGEINEKQHEAISNMKDCNKELLELVQILLDTYKIKETGIDLDKENIDLIPFATSIIDEMRLIADKSGINIYLYAKEGIKIHADKMQIKRVIKNLIQNAISHSQSNNAVNVNIEQHDDFAYIKITDYGKGISKEDIDKIFNKYYSTAKKFRKIGTGLGLYLSKQIIKSHGGEIFVTSEENVSTEFCIKLGIKG